MDYSHILIKPVRTEKSSISAELLNQVAFYVNQKATKTDIKKAVELAFNVKVLAVNVVKKKATPRSRYGRVIGKVPGYKKAYITLDKDSKIELFGGV